MALPPSSKYLQRAADPVDETERESLTTRLNSAFADGRITHDELNRGCRYVVRAIGDESDAADE